MKPIDIPIYDASAAIACSLSQDEIRERMALLNRLRMHITGVRRTRYGLLLSFPADPTIEADVQRFAVAEKNCCPFWGFDVTTDDQTTLRWDGPPSVSDLLDRIGEAWSGRETFESIASLL